MLAAAPSAVGQPGSTTWAKRYNGPGNSYDEATSLGVSPDGSKVFVTGPSTGSSSGDDYATVAYDASTGTRLWVSRYNGPANYFDWAHALAVSPDGSTVFVTGVSYGGPATSNDYATVAYDAATGAQRWVSRYNGPGNSYEDAAAVGTSPDGSLVFVTGLSYGLTSQSDYATVAYDAATGAQRWVSRYDGPGNYFDGASSLGVSPDGATVFVTGLSDGLTSDDVATIAYAAATGTQLWVRRYHGPGGNYANGPALSVDPDGSRVFVTGASWGGPATADDYATIAYDATTGDRLWVRRFDGRAHGFDDPVGVGASPDASKVFVTGISRGMTSADDYATVAYDASTGAKLWVRRYNGPGNYLDDAAGLTVSPDGSAVIVAGSSYGVSGNQEYATIAYDASTGAKLWLRRHSGQGNFNQADAVRASTAGTTVFVTGDSSAPASYIDYSTIAYATS